MRPWLPPDAVDFMDSILTPQSWVIEHGAGQSTIWLAQRAARVISYEGDPKWYVRVGGWLYRYNLVDKVTLIYCGDIAERGAVLPRNAPQDAAYDLIFVDGRGRVRFWLDFQKYLKPGGWLCFDDAERPKYMRAMDTLFGWKQKIFLKPEKPGAFTLFAQKPGR